MVLSVTISTWVLYFTFYNANRKEEYKTFLAFTDTDPAKLITHCSTRWLYLEKCVNRFLQQWPALKSYFNSHDDVEKPGRVKRCAEFLNNEDLHIYYMFLDFILGP